ncbi:MAG: GTPase HflX [Candidatus Bathyarchaeia archaeon]
MLVYRREPHEQSCMEELKSLAEAADYEVVGIVEQVRTPHPRYNIGPGKAKELAQMVRDLGAEKIIFGNQLKTVQIYNLAKITGVEIIDRFQLILEIFIKRASTKEAKLQIELARLQYELAHAKEKVRLAKMGEQPGFHGLGRYEADVYYNAIKRRIHKIQEKLKEIRKLREIHRARRAELDFPLISLTGYTNSGKSTLFNALTKENVLTGPEVFTTLSTTTRAIEIFGEKVFITDTVGFIDRLPITLIEAFYSTLEEITYSDLILLVVDVSDPLNEILRKFAASFEVLERIGATGIPTIAVLNKIDLLSQKELNEKIKYLSAEYTNLTFVPISALHETNLDHLKMEIAKILGRYKDLTFSIPMCEETFSFLSWVYENANVYRVAYNDDSLTVHIGAPQNLAEKIKSFVNRIGGKIVQSV